MRGFVGGLVTVFIPLGVMIASSFAAFTTDSIGWRGLILVGLVPAAFTLVVRAWVPESPHWLISQGRAEEARKSLSRALKVPAAELTLSPHAPKQQVAPWSDLLLYPKSLAVSFMAIIGRYLAEVWPTRLRTTGMGAAYGFGGIGFPVFRV